MLNALIAIKLDCLLELQGGACMQQYQTRVFTNVGMVFRTGTLVFDQNRRKLKHQFFLVRDTVFTWFLVRRLCGQAQCPCVPFAGQMTYYWSTGTLSSTHSLTATAAVFMSCPPPFILSLKHFITWWSNTYMIFICTFETVEQWTSLIVCVLLSLQMISTQNTVCTKDGWRLSYFMSPSS